MWEEPGYPLWLLLLVLIGIPIAVAAFFGAFSFKGLAKDAFHCKRCDRPFQQKAWRRFPKQCPRCRATDWNADVRE
jgi:hypothetical protein